MANQTTNQEQEILQVVSFSVNNKARLVVLNTADERAFVFKFSDLDSPQRTHESMLEKVQNLPWYLKLFGFKYDEFTLARSFKENGEYLENYKLVMTPTQATELFSYI